MQTNLLEDVSHVQKVQPIAKLDNFKTKHLHLPNNYHLM